MGSEMCIRDSAFVLLVPGRNPFHAGNKPRSMDINVFHDRTGHLSEPIFEGIRPTAGHYAHWPDGTVQLLLAGERAEGSGGEEERRTGGA